MPLNTFFHSLELTGAIKYFQKNSMGAIAPFAPNSKITLSGTILQKGGVLCINLQCPGIDELQIFDTNTILHNSEDSTA